MFLCWPPARLGAGGSPPGQSTFLWTRPVAMSETSERLMPNRSPMAVCFRPSTMAALIFSTFFSVSFFPVNFMGIPC